MFRLFFFFTNVHACWVQMIWPLPALLIVSCCLETCLSKCWLPDRLYSWQMRLIGNQPNGTHLSGSVCHFKLKSQSHFPTPRGSNYSVLCAWVCLLVSSGQPQKLYVFTVKINDQCSTPRELLSLLQCNEKPTCWLTACYWTTASDSSLREIHIKTLNNIFEGLQQSECVQKGRNNGNGDIFEVVYKQSTILQHHGQHHWSMKAGEKKPRWIWKDSWQCSQCLSFFAFPSKQ